MIVGETEIQLGVPTLDKIMMLHDGNAVTAGRSGLACMKVKHFPGISQMSNVSDRPPTRPKFGMDTSTSFRCLRQGPVRVHTYTHTDVHINTCKVRAAVGFLLSYLIIAKAPVTRVPSAASATQVSFGYVLEAAEGTAGFGKSDQTVNPDSDKFSAHRNLGNAALTAVIANAQPVDVRRPLYLLFDAAIVSRVWNRRDAGAQRDRSDGADAHARVEKCGYYCHPI